MNTVETCLLATCWPYRWD